MKRMVMVFTLFAMFLITNTAFAGTLNKKFAESKSPDGKNSAALFCDSEEANCVIAIKTLGSKQASYRVVIKPWSAGGVRYDFEALSFSNQARIVWSPDSKKFAFDGQAAKPEQDNPDYFVAIYDLVAGKYKVVGEVAMALEEDHIVRTKNGITYSIVVKFDPDQKESKRRCEDPYPDSPLTLMVVKKIELDFSGKIIKTSVQKKCGYTS